MKLTIVGGIALVAALISTPVLAGGGRHHGHGGYHGGYGGHGSWGHHGWRPLEHRGPRGRFYQANPQFWYGGGRRYVEPFRGGWGGTILPPADWAAPRVVPEVVAPPPEPPPPPPQPIPQVVPAPVIVPPARAAIPAWKFVVDDYRRIGYSQQVFTNSRGNTWNIWISSVSGNTLIFPNSQGYQGDPFGYNCLPVVAPNQWAQCTRYHMITGAQISPFWGMRVVIGPTGLVDDSPN
jgi:hypothetical protein